MTIWKKNLTIEELNNLADNTMLGHMDIVLTEKGENYLQGTMPVDARSVQRFGMLHGGASVTLAESLGSVAASLCVENGKHCVGVEINANHLKAVPSGNTVTGIAKPIRIGRTLHVWQIDISNSKGQPVCTSRLTLAVIETRS